MIIAEDEPEGTGGIVTEYAKPEVLGPPEPPQNIVDRGMQASSVPFFQTPDYEKQPPSWGQEATNGIISGFNQIRGLGTFAAAMGADAMQWDGVEASLLNTYSDIMEENEKYRGTIGSLEDIGSSGNGFRDFARWGVYTVAQQLPLFAVGGVGGTLGRMAAGKLAMNTFGKMVAEVGAEEAGKVVAKRVALKTLMQKSAEARGMVDAGTALGAAAANYPMAAGEIGSSVYEKTGEMDPELAFTAGLFSASLDAVPQFMAIKSIFGKEVAGELAEGVIKKFGPEVAKQSFAEAGTEGLQGFIENVAINIKDPTYPVLGEEGLSNVLNSAAAGFLVGGVVGVPANLNKLGAGRSNDPKVNQSQTSVRDKVESTIGDDANINLNEEENQATDEDLRISGLIARQGEINEQLKDLTPEDEGFTKLQTELAGIEAEIDSDVVKKKVDAANEAEAKGEESQKSSIIVDDKRLKDFRKKMERPPTESEMALLARQTLNDQKLNDAPEGTDLRVIRDDNKRLQAQLLGTPVDEDVPLRGEPPMGTQGNLPKTVLQMAELQAKTEALEESVKQGVEAMGLDSEGSGFSDIKKRFLSVLSPYKGYLAERGVKLKVVSTIVPGVGYDEKGNIELALPKLKKYATEYVGTDLEAELQTVLPKKMEEEIVHVEQIHVARQEALDQGLKGDAIGKFIEAKFARQGAALRMANPDLPAQVERVYGKIGTAKMRESKINELIFREFNRQVVQRVRTGKITEDIQAAEKVRRNGGKEGTAAATQLEAIYAALRTLKEAIARYFNPETAPKAFKEFTDKVNAGLDAFALVGPEVKRATGFGDIQDRQTAPAREQAPVPTAEEREVRFPVEVDGFSEMEQVTQQPEVIGNDKAGVNFGVGKIDRTKLQENLDAGMPMAEAREAARVDVVNDNVSYAPSSAAAPEEISRFEELTENFNGSIEDFKQNNPSEYAELEKMRADVLARAGYKAAVFHGSPIENLGVIRGDAAENTGRGKSKAIFLSSSSDEANYYRRARASGISEQQDLDQKRFNQMIGESFDNPDLFDDVDFKEELTQINSRLENAGRNYPLFVKTKNPVKVDATDFVFAPRVMRQMADDKPNRDFIFTNATDSQSAGRSDIYVVRNPNQIKSADPLALDDNGNLITPDQWANEEDDRIAYAPASKDFIPASIKASRAQAKGLMDRVENAFEGANETSTVKRRGNQQLSNYDETDFLMTLPNATVAKEAAAYIEAHPEGVLGAGLAAMARKTKLSDEVENGVAWIAARELKDVVGMRERMARTIDQRDEANKMRASLENLVDFVRYNGTVAGRVASFVAGMIKMYGPAEAVGEYYNRGANKLKSILGGDGTLIENITKNLTRETSREAERVMKQPGFVRAVRSWIRKSVQDSKRMQKAMTRDIARNVEYAVDMDDEQTRTAWENIFSFAASLKNEEGGEEHMNALIDKLIEDISFGMGKRNVTTKDIDKLLNIALTESTRDLLRDAGLLSKYETAEKVPTIEKLKRMVQSDARRESFIKALSEGMAEKFKLGTADPEFKKFAQPILDQLSSRGYSNKVLSKAVMEEAKELKVKINDLIKGTWGQGMEKASKIIDAFEEKLGGLPREKVELIVNDISAFLESQMAQKYLDSIGVTYDKDTKEVKTIRGLKRINDAIKDEKFLKEVSEKALGNANVAKHVKNLADIAGMSMRGSKQFKETLAQLVTEKMGVPKEIAREIESQFLEAMEAQTAKMLESQKKALGDRLIKLEAAAVTAGTSKRKVQSVIEELIKQANKGFLDDTDTYNALRKLFPKYNLPEFKPEVAEQLREMGEKIESIPDGRTKKQLIQEAQRFIDSQVPLTKGEIATTWMYFSMLSGPQTWLLVNPISNFMSLVGNTLVQGSQNPTRIPAMFSSMLRAATDEAYKDFRITMKTGIQPGRIEIARRMLPIENVNPTVQPLLSKLFTYTGAKFLTRFLGATDIYFNRLADIAFRAAKGINPYSQEEKAAAKEQAIRELRDAGMYVELGEQIADFYSDLRASEILDQRYGAADPKYSQLLANIQREAQKTTFTQEPQGLIGVIAGLISGFTQDQPYARAVVPFTHVVANVFNEQLNWTPWSFLRYSGYSLSRFGKDTKETYMTRDLNGDLIKDQTLLWKGAYGTFLMTTIALLAAEGIDDDDPWFAIYGAGPLESSARKQFFDNGGKPYSVKIGDTYISYLVSPIAMALASVGSYQDSIRNGDTPENVADMLSRAGAAMYNSVTSQSFLTSLQDFAGAASSYNPENQLSRFFARFATLPVPNALKQADRIFNPRVTDAQQFTEYVMRDIPVVNLTLESRYNEAGEQVDRKGGFFGRFVTQRENSPLWSFLAKNGLEITSHKNSALLGNEPMTRQQRTKYVRTAGPRIKQAILENRALLEGLDKEQAQEWIKDRSSEIRKQVRFEMQQGI